MIGNCIFGWQGYFTGMGWLVVVGSWYRGGGLNVAAGGLRSTEIGVMGLIGPGYARA